MWLGSWHGRQHGIEMRRLAHPYFLVEIEAIAFVD
jgi:hypothetical protein